MQKGLFSMGDPVTSTIWVVHRCSARSWAQRCHQCFRYSYIYNTIFPQVWLADNHAGNFIVPVSCCWLINDYYFQYICENHFQRLSKRSLFTGLKASNHFGRPDMSAFLRFVQRKHSYVSFNSRVLDSNFRYFSEHRDWPKKDQNHSSNWIQYQSTKPYKDLNLGAVHHTT